MSDLVKVLLFFLLIAVVVVLAVVWFAAAVIVWIVEAVAALRRNQPLPSFALPRSASDPKAGRTALAFVALLGLLVAIGNASETPTSEPASSPVAADAALDAGENATEDSLELGDDQPDVIRVPDVVGMIGRKAARRLRRKGLEVERVARYSDDVPKGLVIKQSPRRGKELVPYDYVTIVVSKGPRPAPEPEPPPEPEPHPEPEPEPEEPPEDECHPSYEGACLDPNVSDYDCEGGSGDGPEYVAGPISVVGSDDYDLDRDSDGEACE